ncbi:MAG: tRNA A-37 threonylcarbamoyl transferase component Bud32 [Myxococcota bacterium]|jgi:tRNA A-37 threonylcarbamoyl transferase component Bud32
MAEVELCMDRRLGRPVARKLLRWELQSVEECRRRFVREIQVQSQLDHPAIVPVFDSGQDEDGRDFFTMRRIGGVTLGAAIAAVQKIPYPDGVARERSRLLAAFLQACLAVDYAHSRGVIHRDIKPGNLMIGRYGELYVLDWGVAKVRSDTADHIATETLLSASSADSELTEGRRMLGTPAYMSPEQARNPSDATPRSDVYALGCVLFQLLTGTRLRSEPLRGWPKGEALHPSRLNPTLPPELDRICERACNPDPAARYATARQLHDAVESIVRGDRDLALRQQLAAGHLAQARQHAEDGAESAVLREAGRALSLDPTSTDAAGLLARYFLAPSEDDPAPLRDERQQIDAVDGRRMLVTNAATAGVILAVIGLLGGLHNILRPDLLIAAILPAVLGAVVLATNAPGVPRSATALARSVAVSVGFSAPIALSAPAFGPWVLPPLITCVTCVVVAGVVAIGWRRLLVISSALGTLAATLAVYALRGPALGLAVTPQQHTMQAVIVQYDPTWTPIAVAVLCVVMVAAGTAVTWRNTDALLSSRHRLHRYEWRLRQITDAPAKAEQTPPRQG